MTTALERIRIGVVGAGDNTRRLHIPRFQAIPGVEVVCLANRTRASGERAASGLGVARVHTDWQAVIADPEVDAVCIGTWPCLHAEVTQAALAADKHVLCEARMAMDAHQARGMLDAARARPDRVAQLVPAPFTLAIDAVIRAVVEDGRLGELLSAEICHTSGAFADPAAPLHWRQDITRSGLNVLTLGIWYETVLRWIGPAARVSALTRIAVPRRRDEQGVWHDVRVPDHVDVLAMMRCGAAAHFRMSAVTGGDPRCELSLYGSEATLRVRGLPAAVALRRRGATDWEPLAHVGAPSAEGVPAGWQVEEEFVNAIRGTGVVQRTTFEDGVRYMEFTEAVAQSAARGHMVEISP